MSEPETPQVIEVEIQVEPWEVPFGERPGVDHIADGQEGLPWRIRVCLLTMEAAVAQVSLAARLKVPPEGPWRTLEVDGEPYCREHEALFLLMGQPGSEALLDLVEALRQARLRAMTELLKEGGEVLKQAKCMLEHALDLRKQAQALMSGWTYPVAPDVD